MLEKKLQNRKNKGSALVVALFILAIILISALSIALVAVKERKASIGSAGSNKAYQASETGIESVMQLIMKGNHDFINNSSSGVNNLYANLPASISCNTSTGILEGNGYEVQLLDSTPAQIDCNDPSLPVSDIVKIKSVGESSNSKRAVEALVSNKSTKLLMHFNDINNDGDFNDSSYSRDGYNISNEGASMDNADPILAGTDYAKFSAPGDYVKIEDAITTDDVDFYFSDKDFTIEAWVKFDSLVGYPTIISMGDYVSGSYADSSFWLYWDSSDNNLKFQYYNQENNDIKELSTSWTTPTVGTWYHVAFERRGGSGYFFIDGLPRSINAGGDQFGTDSIYFTDSYPIIIGGWLEGGSHYSDSQFFGNMDELRITKGVARYTNDFDPWEDVEYVPNI